MNKVIKFPTILAIIILVIGLVTTVFLIKSKQTLKSEASSNTIPKNVRVTNITNSQITVTWTTDLKSNGFVKWGNDEKTTTNVVAEENLNNDSSQKSFVHSTTITGLPSNSVISFKINSEGEDYTNNGIVWQSKTSSVAVTTNNNKLASGIILNPDGITPANSLVYLSVNGKLLSALTSLEGSFVIPLSTYFEEILDSTIIEISVIDGQSSTTQAVAYPQTVKSTPTMILGKTYDFRTITQTDDSSLPESSLSIPESIEISSRFEVTKNGDSFSTTSVTLESVNNGEIINTTDPEFFGSAPMNSEIEIQVESELQTDKITTNTKGKWSWSPPKTLETGEHKITLKWKDANGVLRTLTRNFIVQASEGPAFESTPSATPIKTLPATSTPVSLVTIKPESTTQPIPETGSLTTTVGLFIMGIGVIMSSIFVYKHSFETSS